VRHLIVVRIIHKTDFRVFREYRTFQKIAVGFAVAFAQRLDDSLIYFKRTYRFGEDGVGDIHPEIQIQDYHLHPIGRTLGTRFGPHRKIALVVGVNVYAMALARDDFGADKPQYM